MVLQAIKINEEVLVHEYHGCGKAWVAVKGGEVVAIRYMGEGRAPLNLPAWVQAIRKNATGLDSSMLPTVYGSGPLSKIAAAAAATSDCPIKPKGGRYRPTELLLMARAVILAADGAAFDAYRAKCRGELAMLGEVVSGICSCTEFVPGA